MFPASTISVLAISTHDDQAVMTSTLGLWRNLGTVMGVAISSLIVQNGLVFYLERLLTGPNKFEVSKSITFKTLALILLDHSKSSQIRVDDSAAGWVTSTGR
jgi:hypothetical protein